MKQADLAENNKTSVLSILAQDQFPASTVAGTWLNPWRFSLLLCALIFAAFPDVLLGTKSFVFRDYGFYTYPNAHYFRECFWRGEIPLWNPLSFCGIPFLAQWNTMVFYPGSLFYLLLPLPWSLGFFTLLHLFIAGAGMYALASDWLKHELSAAAAAITFVFSGIFLSSIIWPGNVAALAWTPWIVLLTQRAWHGSARDWLKAAWLGAIQMLTGAAEIILLTWLIVAAFALADLLKQKSGYVRVAIRFIGITLFIGALAAIQLFPFLDLLTHSARNTPWDPLTWAVPGWGLANLLVPLFYCVQSGAGVYFQPGQYYFASYYLGIAVLAMVLFSLLKVRNYRVWVLGFILISSFVLAMGEHAYVYVWLRNLIPQLAMMNFTPKFLFAAAFAVPLLAAFGIQFCAAAAAGQQRQPWKWLAMIAGLFVILCAAICWISYRYPFIQESWKLTVQNGLTRVLLLGIILGTLYVMFRVTEPGRRVAWQLAFLLFLWVDVMSHAPSQNPTVDPSVFQLQLPPHTEMKPRPEFGQSRLMLTRSALDKFQNSMVSKPFDNYLCNRLALYNNANLLEGIPKVDGFYPLYVSNLEEMYYKIINRTIPLSPRMLDFMGVSQITSPTNYFEYVIRPNYMPLIAGGQQPVFATDEQTLKSVCDPSFDPRQSVFLPAHARSSITTAESSTPKISKQTFTSHRIEMEIEAPGPAIVTLAQTYYHPWKPYVDGKPVPLWPANYAFQALEVPAGKHHVKVVYQDRAFYLGAIVSVLAWMGAGIAWFFLGRQQRSSQ